MSDRANTIVDRIHDEARALQQLGIECLQLGWQLEADDHHEPVAVAKRLESLAEKRDGIGRMMMKYHRRCEALQRARDLASAELTPAEILEKSA